MKFRPCIDLHDGQVKQIVGSTLRDEGPDNGAATITTTTTATTVAGATNFATTRPAAEFAALYRRDQLSGGHVILLGPGNDEAARGALAAFPGGLHVGGGIRDTNAVAWLDAGASHVIVTSHVFDQGRIRMDRLEELVAIVGKERLVLDLSCRRRPDLVGTPDEHVYFVVTNKWQTFTDYRVTAENLQHLSQYCAEFLVHGVDVEGQRCGVLEDLIALLGQASPIPVTYAGGVRSLADLDAVDRVGAGRVDCTVGSALDLFGGDLAYEEVVQWHHAQQQPRQSPPPPPHVPAANANES